MRVCRGGLLASATAAAVLLATPGAYAAPVPPPTVQTQSTLAGTTLPASTFMASWHVTTPGRSAELDVSGVALPETTNTVRAEWTSAWRRVRANQKGLRLDLTDSANVVLPGNPDASAAVRVFLRRPHGAWLPLGANTYQVSYPIASTDNAGTSTIVFLEKTTRVQWRVDLQLVIADTARHTLSAKLTAY
jgi:hypothetical protein